MNFEMYAPFLHYRLPCTKYINTMSFNNENSSLNSFSHCNQYVGLNGYIMFSRRKLKQHMQDKFRLLVTCI